MDKIELAQILELHKKWAAGENGGKRADLYGAYLSGADLSGADLSGADLSGADLSRAYLSGAKGISVCMTTPLAMLLDQPGEIVSYKLVNEKREGPFNSGIRYEDGSFLEVADASTDENKDCDRGINLASLDWCLREWKPGYQILKVVHTASDIACIPIGTDGKYRVHRCRVIGVKEIDYAALGLVKQDKEA